MISCLDQLAKCLPTRRAWDELVFLPPPAEPHMPCQSGHLGYIRGCVVDLGWVLPSLHFCISEPVGDFICMVQGLLFKGSVLAYDPTTNGVEWIPMWGSASDRSPAEEVSTQELSNIVLHDPVRSCRGWTTLENKWVRVAHRKPWSWVTNPAQRGMWAVTDWMAHIPPGVLFNTP